MYNVNDVDARLTGTLLDMHCCFSRHVCWNFKKSKKKGAKSIAHEEGVELKICASDEGQKTLKNAVQAMHNMNMLSAKLNNFGNSFLNHIIKPIISGTRFTHHCL